MSQQLPPRNPAPWKHPSLTAMALGTSVVLGLCAIVLAATRAFPGRIRNRDDQRRASCAANVLQLSRALQMYALDYDDRLPAADAWESAARPYHRDPRLHACPSDPGHTESYAFNTAIGRRNLKQMTDPAAVPVLFDSSLHTENAHDLIQSWAPRHLRARRPVGIVGYADSHMKAVARPPAPRAGIAGGR